MRRLLLVVPALLLVVAGCGTKDGDVDKAPTGEQAKLATMKEACPDMANAILATSPTAAEQLRTLADQIDAISDDGDVEVKNTLGDFPVTARGLAADLQSSTIAKKYAADVADIDAACTNAGAPFPTS